MKCPRCKTLMTFNERGGNKALTVGTFECPECNKIIQGFKAGDNEPQTTYSECCNALIVTSAKDNRFCSKCKKQTI